MSIWTEPPSGEILADVLTMIKTLEADRSHGPYILYVPRRRRVPRRVKKHYFYATRNKRRERLIIRWFLRRRMS